MPADQYSIKMDIVVNSFRSTVAILETLSDAELRKLLDTVDRADSLSFLMVAPMTFGQVNDNLGHQREILNWARQTLALYEKLKTEIAEKASR